MKPYGFSGQIAGKGISEQEAIAHCRSVFSAIRSELEELEQALIQKTAETISKKGSQEIQ